MPICWMCRLHYSKNNIPKCNLKNIAKYTHYSKQQLVIGPCVMIVGIEVGLIVFDGEWNFEWLLHVSLLQVQLANITLVYTNRRLAWSQSDDMVWGRVTGVFRWCGYVRFHILFFRLPCFMNLQVASKWFFQFFCDKFTNV